MSISTIGSLPITQGYGAGVLGARLAIPSGAVAATPANLDSLVGSNPTSTDFALAAGTYTGEFSNKTGNGYYGDPNDHTAVVFDGGLTYANSPPNIGETPTGGSIGFMSGLSNNTWANLTIQKYQTTDTNNNGGVWTNEMVGQSNILLQNIETKDIHMTGIHIGGSNHTVRFCTSRWNGQYGIAGGGINILVENCLVEGVGDDTVTTRGIVARHTSSNRGGGKWSFSNGNTIRNCNYKDLLGYVTGIWFDIDNFNVTVENNLVERVARRGIFIELGHGGTVTGNTLINCHTSSDPLTCDSAVITWNAGGPVTFENNVIRNDSANSGWNGISFSQYSRDYTFGEGFCGSTVRNNEIGSFFVNNWVSVHGTFIDPAGCDPTIPSNITIENNTELGSGISFHHGTDKTPAEWATLGYS